MRHHLRAVPADRDDERFQHVLPHRGDAGDSAVDGLEATTRAYALIIDGVNRLELSELQRLAPPQPSHTLRPANWPVQPIR